MSVKEQIVDVDRNHDTGWPAYSPDLLRSHLVDCNICSRRNWGAAIRVGFAGCQISPSPPLPPPACLLHGPSSAWLAMRLRCTGHCYLVHQKLLFVRQGLLDTQLHHSYRSAVADCDTAGTAGTLAAEEAAGSIRRSFFFSTRDSMRYNMTSIHNSTPLRNKGNERHTKGVTAQSARR